MIEQRLWFDPQDKPGKRCPICGWEHFNEGDLCTECEERNDDSEID